MVDHLFRHEYGKMVAILLRSYGTKHLSIIEDAVQDSFMRALRTWPRSAPDKPEAWLMRVAKNRLIDELRKKDHQAIDEAPIDAGAGYPEEVYLERALKDAQLRLLFMSCHPALLAEDQLAFALRTISGFSQKEVADALLLKDETAKKRLGRARKRIAAENLRFELPTGYQLVQRRGRVMEVLYLLFIESFHSSRGQAIMRDELCAEAIRLCKLMTEDERVQSPELFALYALMCFHFARAKSRVNAQGEPISLKDQDRSLWRSEWVVEGHRAIYRALDTEQYSVYHVEAAIAAEHLKAERYEDTDWDKLIQLYTRLQEAEPSAFNAINLVVICMEKGDLARAVQELDALDKKELGDKICLYHACRGQCFKRLGEIGQAEEAYLKAVETAKNEKEKAHFQKELRQLSEA